MEGSTTFVAYQELIRSGWLKFQSLELASALDLLEKKGLITTAEHLALLELAKSITDGDPPQAVSK